LFKLNSLTLNPTTAAILSNKMTPTETTTAATTTTAAASTESTAEKIDALKKAAAQKRSSRSSRSSSRTASMKSGRSTSADSGDESSFVSNGSSRMEEYLEPNETHHLWGCELSRKSDTHAVKFPVDADADTESHFLVFKSAALGVDAEKDRNVVEIHYHDRDDKEARHVLTALTLGVSEFCRLDLRIELISGRDVTLKLVKGSGPVSILGNYIVESYADAADVDTEDVSADEDFKPDDSKADLETSDASGMETEGDEVDGDEVKDITEDAKEVGEPTSKDRKAKE